MKNNLFPLFVLLLIAFNSSAQECNCSESFSWLINTFEKNDAGFQYVIDKKGLEQYKKHTALFRDQTSAVNNLQACQALMSDWLQFFRSGHLGVYIKEPGLNSKEPPVDSIRLKYKDEKTIDLTEKQLINILEKKQDRNPIEGIWHNGDYTIGILRNEKSNRNFTAFIIAADSIYWMPKQVKSELTLNEDNKTFSAIYYLRNHFKEASEAYFVSDSCSLLSLYNNYWVRMYPNSTLSKEEELLLSFSDSRFPFVEKLSDKTIYLRIPSFSGDQKKNIDSVLAKYDEQISNTDNLIIDIRNGTGGSDDSYEKIIPYLYSNPIRNVGIQLFATELNAQGYERYAKLSTDSAGIIYCKSVATKLRENLGQFITMKETFNVDSLKGSLLYPKKIAIICNHKNGSTDEQFLIDARQSYKVKIFGRPTGGMLDISNVNIVDFPDEKFVLAYCMSKSYRIPVYCIDGVGIQPDYFIDDAVPEQDWIEYTKEILEQ